MQSPTSPENFPKPSTITGGCLCGAIRYQVDFPEDHDFLDNVRKNPFDLPSLPCRLPLPSRVLLPLPAAVLSNPAPLPPWKDRIT